MIDPRSTRLRRRSWLGFLSLSTLLAACGGGGGGDAHWDTASSWDEMSWN